MCGKYSYENRDISGTDLAKQALLEHIANELAEANRLKRIELDFYGRVNGLLNPDRLKRIQEDRA